MAKIFKQKLILVIVVIVLTMLASVATIVFAENLSAPALIINTPQENAVVETASTVISFTVSDPDLLSDTSGAYYIKVNGNSIGATIQFRGHPETDAAGAQIWVIDGYDEATITGNAAGLLNGKQTVEVMATDRQGNVVNKTWTFDVAVKPTFLQMNPAPASSTTNNTSASVKISVNGTLDPSSVAMKVDGTAVQASYNVSTGIVSYTANPPLSAGLHNIEITAGDTAGVSGTGSWSYTCNLGPSMTFADAGTTFTTPSPTLAVTVNSTVKLAQYAAATVDGKAVSATFTYPGTWVHSTCSSSYIVSSYYQGTIAVPTANLKDGEHTLVVTSKDQNNTASTQQWTFNVNSKPVIFAPTPGSGASTTDTSGFTIKVTDNDSIVQSSIIAKLDGGQVETAFDSVTGLVYYKPAGGLTDGTHTVNITAADTTGNVSTYTWSFIIETTGPQVTFNNEGTAFTNAAPALTFALSSTVKLDSNVALTFNGQPVTATFTYLGHWVRSTCSSSYIVDDYTKGTVTFQPGTLKDGVYTVVLTAKDTLGNVTVKQGSFTINSRPVLFAAVPAGNSTVNTNNGFSIKVADNDAINESSIVVKLDGSQVNAVFDAVTGTLSYQDAAGIPDGVHNVNVSVADTTGNVSTYSWSFTVKTVGPGMSFVDANITYNSYKPTVTINVYSTVKISDIGNIMTINGNPINASFKYKGHFESDYCGSTWVVDDYTKGTLTAFPELSDGSYIVSATTKDVSGNSSTKSWSFSVSQPPVFSKTAPTGTTASKNPTITATISDPNGPALDKASIRLMVDNVVVSPTLTDSNGTVVVSYTPSSITDDSSHSVSLTAADTAGNSASASWSFYKVTKADMPVIAQDCGACHTLNAYNKYVHSMSPDAGMVGSGGSCGHCHHYTTAEFCGYCHDGDPWAQVDGAPADQSFDANLNCIFCHGLSDNLMVQRKVITSIPPERELSSWYKIPHNLPQLHTFNKGSCNNCHSIYLTREHNRVTKSGVQITCLTCHKSTNFKVQQAIAAKNLDCAACHDNAGHEAAHTGDLDSNCQTCHKGELTQEHLSNSTTQGKNFDCSTCHDDTGKQVKRTIATGKLNCTGCHSQGHNMVFADTIPTDITLMTGFTWSDPLEASIFKGDTSTPSGYEDGQVVFSNRHSDIAAQDVWEYYNRTLTTSQWTLKSGAPAATDQIFTAEFVKDSHAVIIRSYNTDNSDGSGEVAGCRVEIWFK